jgi:hypothetical protein
MPQWDVTVANMVYIRLDAETEDEAAALAKHRIAGERGHEPRVLAIAKIAGTPAHGASEAEHVR